MSYAAWQGGGYTTVTVDGSIGKFYVNYPKYKPATQMLQANTRYVTVTHSDGTVDCYEMHTHASGDSDVQLQYATLVPLAATDTVAFTKGNEQLEYTFENTSVFDFKEGSTTEGQSKDGAGAYTFYYKEYKDSNTTDGIWSIKETVDYTINFANNVSVPLHVKYGSAFAVYIYKQSGAILITWPGRASTATAQNRIIDATQFTYGTDDVRIIFNNNGGGKQTGDGEYAPKFEDYFVPGKDNYVELYDDSSYGSHGMWFRPPTVTKVESTELYGDMDVRNVTGTTTGSGTTYTYHNYVCVSRTGSEATMAYVNFSLPSCSNPNADLTSMVVMRSKTVDEGLPNGQLYSAPELVYGLPETGAKLADITGTPKQEDGSNATSEANTAYIDGGAYIMLYFGAGEKQYYCLDVEITTSEEVTFNLVATATNVDKRSKYEEGEGDPYGYYLGGVFNGVSLWDPREATKFTKNSVTPTPETNNLPTYIDITLDVKIVVNEGDNGSAVKLYRLGSDGKRENGADTLTMYFIPKNVQRNYPAPDGIKYDGELDLIIKSTGTYRLHYFGKVESPGAWESWPAVDRVNGTVHTEQWIGQQQGISLNDIASDGGKRFLPLPATGNFIVDNLYINRIEDDSPSAVEVRFHTNDADATFSSTGLAQGWTVSDDNKTLTTNVEWGTAIDFATANAAVVVPSGKTFAGNWYKETGCTNVFAADTLLIDGTYTVVDNNGVKTAYVDLYAKWSDAAYTVTLNYNKPSGADGEVGNTVANPSAAHAVAFDVSTIAKPTLDSHNFKGWLCDLDGCSTVHDPDNATTKYIAAEKVTKNFTLTAQWQIKTLTVTYDSNGGSTMQPATVNYGATLAKPTDPTYNGYRLVAWHKTSVTGDVFKFATETGAEAVKTNLTLVAEWETVEYAITFNTNSGTFAGGYEKPAAYNVTTDTISLPTAENISRTYYTFAGWYDNSGLTGTAVTQIAKGSTGNKTFWAKWEANGYIVVNGGTPIALTKAADISGYAAVFTTTTQTLSGGDVVTFKYGADAKTVTLAAGSTGVHLNSGNTGLTVTRGTDETFSITFKVKASGNSDVLIENTSTVGYAHRYGEVRNDSNFYIVGTPAANATDITYTDTSGSDIGIKSTAENTTGNPGNVAEFINVYFGAGDSFRIHKGFDQYNVNGVIGDTTYPFVSSYTGNTITIKYAGMYNVYMSKSSWKVYITFVSSDNDLQADDGIYISSNGTDYAKAATNGDLVANPGSPYEIMTPKSGDTELLVTVGTGATDINVYNIKLKYAGSFDTITKLEIDSNSTTITKLTLDTATHVLTLRAGTYRFYYTFIKESDSKPVGRLYVKGTQAGTFVNVTFNSNGGDESVDTRNVPQGAGITLPGAGSKTGYTFGGWSDGTNTYRKGATYTVPTGGKALTAVWDPVTLTVSFNANNTDLAMPTGTTTVEYNGKITMPTAPADTAQYHFVKWLNAASGSEVNGTTTINESTVTIDWATNTFVLYADKSVRTYTVTWKNEDGSLLKTDTDVPYGTTPSYTGATPTKTADAHYTYTHSDWTPAVATVTGDATYTATYSTTVNKYSVTFKKNDGTEANYTTFTNIEYGSTVSGNGVTGSAKPTRDYYGFEGWYDSAEGGNAWKFTGEAGANTITGATTLYAHWTPYKYTVTLDKGAHGALANGVSSTLVVPYTSFTDGSYDIPTAGMIDADSGWSFGGWSPKELFAANIRTGDNTITVTAQYNESVSNWNISYDMNAPAGTTPTAPSTASVAQNTAAQITDPTLTGYTFGGWELKTGTISGNITPVTGGKHTVTPTSDITLKAIWKVTITLNANNGEFSATTGWTISNDKSTATIVVAINASTNLPEPTRTNYIFAGWNDTTTVTDGVHSYAPSQNVQLTAVWKVRITLNANSGEFSATTGWTISNDKSTATIVVDIDTATTLPQPARTYYAFNGWTLSSGTIKSGTSISNTSATPSTNIVLTANWKGVRGVYINSETVARAEFAEGNENQYVATVNNLAVNDVIHIYDTVSYSTSAVEFKIDAAGWGIDRSNTTSKVSGATVIVAGNFNLYINNYNSNTDRIMYANNTSMKDGVYLNSDDTLLSQFYGTGAEKNTDKMNFSTSTVVRIRYGGIAVYNFYIDGASAIDTTAVNTSTWLITMPAGVEYKFYYTPEWVNGAPDSNNDKLYIGGKKLMSMTSWDNCVWLTGNFFNKTTFVSDKGLQMAYGNGWTWTIEIDVPETDRQYKVYYYNTSNGTGWTSDLYETSSKVATQSGGNIKITGDAGKYRFTFHRDYSGGRKVKVEKIS